MSTKAMVATPVRSFGELISQALQELDYFPLLVAGSAEAIKVAQTENFKIAVLDCKMPEPGTTRLAADLHTQIEGLRIIFIHLDEGCENVVSLNPDLDIELARPFYLPDLLEAVAELSVSASATDFSPTPTTMPADISDIPTELAWLKDVNQAAQHLARLSLEIDAQAALIIQGNQIWAYAGQLSQAAAEELAQFVGHHWASGDGGDLARFVRLLTTNDEYMLYVTGLEKEFLLALAFEEELPFSEIRAQTGKLARALLSPPVESSLKIDTTPDTAETSPEASVTPVPEKPSPEIRIPPDPKKSSPPLDIDDFSPEDWIPEDDFSIDSQEDQFEDSAIIERQAAMFEDLLASLDIPDPDGTSQPMTIHQKDTASKHQVEIEYPKVETSQEILDVTPSFIEIDFSLRNDPVTSAEVQLESDTLNVHDLAYACVLLPRLPTHHITGELPELLNREITRLCVAFGWRLEHLALRPQYLHWVVSVGPEVAAAQVIQEIRQHTSALVFESFPRFEKENPSGDFWAQGFMVVHGRRALAGALVQDFIQQTRIRQGYEDL